jgi:hypothetical protein
VKAGGKHCFQADILLGLFFDPENAGNKFRRNFG